MTEFLHVLEQYCSSTNQPLARADSDGIYSIDAGQELFVCAAMLSDGRLELFSSPGYVDAATLQAIIDDDLEDGIEVDDCGNAVGVPGPLMCWEASEAQWSIHLSREDGFVTLSRITTQLPWQLASFTAALEEFRETHDKWVERLQATPAEQALGETRPLEPAHQLGMRI